MGADGLSWQVDLLDEELAAAVVAAAGESGSEGGEALADALAAALDAAGVLSRAGLGAEPIAWRSRTRTLWRLVEPRELWRVTAAGWAGELLVARGADDVTLLLPPAARPDLGGELLLSGYAQLSRSEPYARADWALRDALSRLDGPEPDLGVREPLVFDSTFRGRPEEALFELGLSVEPLPWRRYLTRLLHVYDLEEDFLDRPLAKHDPLAEGLLVAAWLPAPAHGAPPVGRPAIVLLLSVDDRPTQRLLPRLERSTDGAGYALVPAFATTQWSQEPLASDTLVARLDGAMSRAGANVGGLVVHYGAASTFPREYAAALTAFRVRHPDVPLATEALRGERGGTVEGVDFDQPEALDFLLEQIGF